MVRSRTRAGKTVNDRNFRLRIAIMILLLMMENFRNVFRVVSGARQERAASHEARESKFFRNRPGFLLQKDDGLLANEPGVIYRGPFIVCSASSAKSSLFPRSEE